MPPTPPHPTKKNHAQWQQRSSAPRYPRPQPPLTPDAGCLQSRGRPPWACSRSGRGSGTWSPTGAARAARCLRHPLARMSSSSRCCCRRAATAPSSTLWGALLAPARRGPPPVALWAVCLPAAISWFVPCCARKGGSKCVVDFGSAAGINVVCPHSKGLCCSLVTAWVACCRTRAHPRATVPVHASAAPVPALAEGGCGRCNFATRLLCCGRGSRP